MILDIFQVVRVLFEFLFLKIFVSLMMVTLVGDCSLWALFGGSWGRSLCGGECCCKCLGRSVDALVPGADEGRGRPR